MHDSIPINFCILFQLYCFTIKWLGQIILGNTINQLLLTELIAYFGWQGYLDQCLLRDVPESGLRHHTTVCPLAKADDEDGIWDLQLSSVVTRTIAEVFVPVDAVVEHV